ncbi:malonic semialdehyde reductase [Halomonas campisalis]|uniref:Putative NADH dehydrogenase/NAD(P)H nitroreductase HOP52_14370 n=1 Tax=Billgrantia campisalis TaxID=74661 RepID=A0ABS9PCI3_9GAMM|nr:malonic semialdehyde reductase [Halomonas campisalis]MCG6658942.1 malonic semialdehyde reductase [Halomonas campisalis]MDR5863663.1 malonic semialdehyde reductase [Halomonas campisalis]
MSAIGQAAQATLFTEARTHNVWQDRDVSEESLRELYRLMSCSPTSMNCQPLRLQFLQSQAAKEQLLPALLPGNRQKALQAPVVVVLGYDLEFYRHLPRLFAHNQEAQSTFIGKPQLIHDTAFRNSAIQGAFLILAARSLGLDVGPMSGFDHAAVDAEFWPEGRVKTNFLCNLGYGDPEALFPRGERFAFDEICQVL